MTRSSTTGDVLDLCGKVALPWNISTGVVGSDLGNTVEDLDPGRGAGLPILPSSLTGGDSDGERPESVGDARALEGL